MEGLNKNMFYDISDDEDFNNDDKSDDYDVSSIMQKLKTKLDREIDGDRYSTMGNNYGVSSEFKHLFEGTTSNSNFD